MPNPSTHPRSPHAFEPSAAHAALSPIEVAGQQIELRNLTLPVHEKNVDASEI